MTVQPVTVKIMKEKRKKLQPATTVIKKYLKVKRNTNNNGLIKRLNSRREAVNHTMDIDGGDSLEKSPLSIIQTGTAEATLMYINKKGLSLDQLIQYAASEMPTSELGKIAYVSKKLLRQKRKGTEMDISNSSFQVTASTSVERISQLNNKFSILADISGDEELPSKPKKLKTNQQTSNQSKGESHHPPQESQNKESKATEMKTPTIICTKLNVAEFVRMMESAHPQIKYTIKNGRDYKSYLKIDTLENHKIIFDILKTQSIPSFTFTAKEDKKQTVLLKGLHRKCSEEEVYSELTEVFSVDDIVKVSLFTPTKDAKIFMIQFKPGFDLKRIFEVRFLLHQKIHWERIRNSGPIQCKNCQRYGHVASNCLMGYRCVKCSENHGPGQCQRNLNELPQENNQPFCANCGELGHPANFKECRVYQ